MKRFCRLILAGLLFTDTATAEAPKPHCARYGWYRRSCDANWNFATPNAAKAGTTFQGCSAHTLYAWGNDGAMYAILNQCHRGQGCTGSVGLYERPSDPAAAKVWDIYYVTGKGSASPEDMRHAFGYYNESFRLPTGMQTYTFMTLSQIQPASMQRSIAVAQGCTSVPPGSPVPTVTAPVSSPARTRKKVTPSSNRGCPGGVPCTTPTATVKPYTSPTRTIPPTPVKELSHPRARAARDYEAAGSDAGRSLAAGLVVADEGFDFEPRWWWNA